jgi:tetratricopeptide (TPR) repeat protein
MICPANAGEELVNETMSERDVMLRICLLCLTITVFCISAAAQNNVGRIIYLKGTALLRQEDGKVETLTEKDYVRDLQPKQRLKLGRGGQMQIILCDETRPPLPAGKWYPVPVHIICSTPKESPVQRVIASHFRARIRHRTGDAFILYPLEAKELVDNVRPETAEFRWASSTTANLNLSVSIVGVEHAKWERMNVSGADGSFSDDGLKEFLRGVREKHPGATLRLTVRSFYTENTAKFQQNTATFQLVPVEKEQALQQELAALKEENNLLSLLFRADIYLRYGLYIEAADAYEEVLKLSPESVELVKDTAALQERAGNLKRSHELENFIEVLSKKQD